MIPIVILAAGSSSRMGRAKQNLIFDNKTLLQHVITEAKQITDKVIVTVGANKEEVVPTLAALDVKVLDNENWAEGMATSITLALKYLLSSGNEISGVIFLLCDQPFVGIGLLNELLGAATNTENGIIGSAYSGTIGVPVYFKEKYFTELLQLKGKEGAKKMISQFSDDVHSIPFPSGGIDIDTPEDFEKLLSGE